MSKTNELHDTETISDYVQRIAQRNERAKKESEDLQQAREAELSDAGVRYSINLEQVNEQFNNELQQQIDGTLPKGHIYQLGMPSEILQDYGIANLPIQMSATRLAEKATEYNHDYDLSEVRDLVKAINSPIAIFKYGDKTKAQNIVIEIQHNDKNFIVGLSIRPNVNGRILEINSIRNVFPKDNAEWLNWILQDKALYLNKEKIQTLIDQQRTNLADVEYLDLNLLAKVIENFDNNKHKVKKNAFRLSYNPANDPTLTPQAADEMQEIKDKAIANGTYFKAPNGKKSNLDERAWLQVRTEAFKDWFGDWELAWLKDFFLNHKAVAKLTGNEFSKVVGKTLTDQVEDYFKQIGGIAKSPIYGDVILDRNGADDSLAHGMGRNKAIAYAAVKEVIENGVLLDYHKNHKGRGYNTAIVAAPIEIAKERYICYVTIKRNINENRFHIHEVIAQKNLQQDSSSNTGQNQPVIIGDAAKLLQKIVTAKSASKIVDENGEPRVFYSGTTADETTRVWDENTKTFNTEHAPFTIFKRKVDGYRSSGFWFNSNLDNAGGYGSNVYECFLNLRNPLVVDAQGNRYASVPFNNIRMGTDEIAAYAEINGYDGVIFENIYDGVDIGALQNITIDVVAFSPNQIKSATDNNGDFSEENDDIRFSFSNQNNDIFYSNAERAVEGIKQDKATPQQWLAMIDKAGGLKAGEDKWLGLSDWLKSFEIGENETPSEAIARNNKRTITKQEILDFIRQNKIQIEEVNYSELPDIADTEIGKEFYALRKQYAEEDNYQSLVAEYALRAFVELEDKYGDDFSLAFYLGDSDHRLYVNDQEAANYFIGFSHHAINDTRMRYTTNGLTNKREIALVVPTIESWNENDEIHFGDAGEGRAIAWVRFGDTTDEQGNKVLVIDEIQSKRHQEGREKGYAEKQYYKEWSKRHDENTRRRVEVAQRINQIQFAAPFLADFNKWLETDGLQYKEEYTNLIQEQKILDDISSQLSTELSLHDHKIPAAPFEKNWHELAMKRMLRFAAENGYNKVAWTTGEQQAERYDLGSVVKSIELSRWNEPDDFHDIEHRVVAIYTTSWHPFVYTFDRQGNILNGGTNIQGHQPKTIAEVVGKELANRLLTTDESEIKGDNLRIGGEGMRGFYDDMLPRFVSKYAKKWGAKVGEVTMPELQDGYQTMHSVDITEPMKESVMQGQALFSISEKQAKNIVESMERNAVTAQYVEFTEENWRREFGENGIVKTPLGEVKISNHQAIKQSQKGRDTKLGMIKPTLETPQIIIEERSQAKSGKTERPSSYIFIKAFYNEENKERTYLFTSVTIQKDGVEVSISNQEKKKNRVKRLLMEGRLAYIDIATLPLESDTSIQGSKPTKSIGISDDKVTTNDLNTQELGDIFAIAGQPEFREIDDDETLNEYASRYHKWLQQQKDIALFEHYWHEYARRNVNEGKKRLDDQIEEDWFNAELSIERFQDFLKDIGGKVTTNVAHFVWQARGKQTYQQNQVKRNLIYPLMSTVKDLEKLIGTKRGKDTKLHLRWQNLDESKVGRRYKRNGTPVTARELIGLYLQAKDIDECEKLGLPSRGAEGFYNNLL
ncbi:MAG: hypothetical protein IKN91_02620 [Paludibacteraceae bacterium]|nr:hypothetical protein [Paludibacteraceae bacterium]